MVRGARSAVGLALVAVLALALPQAASAAPRLRSLTSPASAREGASLTLSLTISNRSARAAHKVKVALSVVPSSTGLLIKRRAATLTTLRARSTKHARVSVTVPAGRFDGTFAVRACIAKRCLSTRAIQLLAGDAYGRLAAALAAGKLSPGKAGLYEFYAVTRDHRLPKAYRGTAPGGSDTPGLLALSHWATLSAAERKALVPYLLPPTYAQSAWAPKRSKRHGLRSPTAVAAADPAPSSNPVIDYLRCGGRSIGNGWPVVLKGTHVVVHAESATTSETDKAKVVFEAAEKSWSTLVDADHFPAPLSDATCDPASDPRLDIFLIASGTVDEAGGLTVSYCGGSPAYILINQALSDAALRVAVAHEIFHAEQAATNSSCGQPKGWTEGAATWAMDEVYPESKAVHDLSLWSLGPDSFTLKNAGYGTTVGYEAWPFWYWLRKEHGTAAIGRMFSSLHGLSGFDSGVRLAPGTDFPQAWKDFALAFWNQTPIGEPGFPSQSFAAWDRYTTVAAPARGRLDLSLGGSKSGPNPDTYRRSISIQPLSLNYTTMFVADENIKQVTIANGFTKHADVGVELWAETDQGWKRIDLTHQPEKSFCFDNPGETINRATLAVSNASEDAAADNVDIVVNSRCDPHVSFDGTSDCNAICDGSGSLNWSWSGAAKLQLRPSPIPGFAPSSYALNSGTVTVMVTGQTPDGCAIHGHTTIPLVEGLDSIELELFDQPPSYQLNIGAAGEGLVVVYAGCEDPPPPATLPIASIQFAQTPTPIARNPAATTLEDTVDQPAQPGQPAVHYHWKIGL